MIKWAIRHKPTGRFMPQSSSKRHGYTHDEPVRMDSNWCPRLFGRKQDASTALTWWLKGETMGKWVGGQFTNAFGDIDDDMDYEMHTVVCVDRKGEDMEVVQLKLEVAA
jgi:hypothetical protein